MKNRHQKRNLRKIWQLRYRLYAVVVTLVLIPILYSSEKDIQESISIDQGYEIAYTTPLADKIKRAPFQEVIDESAPTGNDSKPTTFVIKNGEVTVYDQKGQIITEKLREAGYNMGFIQSQPFVDLGLPLKISAEEQKNFEKKLEEKIETGTVKPSEVEKPAVKPLDEVVPKPQRAIRRNFLTFPKYKVNAPIIYTGMDDLFYKNKDGTYNYSQPIDQGPINSPVQIKLKDGIVHLAYTPMPGEVGNSYIIGHSSNYSTVRSNYNRVFEAIQEKSRVGDEFFIYDRYGRQLKFCVFEALKIRDSDVEVAYKSFGNKRVVTLQTSILGYRNGRIEATHRWLTRGELCGLPT